jgi:hypothetical protein
VVGGVMKKNRKRTRRKKGFMVGDWHEQAGGNTRLSSPVMKCEEGAGT